MKYSKRANAYKCYIKKNINLQKHFLNQKKIFFLLIHNRF